MAAQKDGSQVEYGHNDQLPWIAKVSSDSLALQSVLMRHKAFCLAQPSTASDFVSSHRQVSLAPDIYWLAYMEGQVVGCISLRDLGDQRGEIKGLHVLETSRRRGVADALLCQLIDYARCREFRDISLETGTSDGFASARRLYRRAGFVERGPFPPYWDHPRSYFMTLAL